MRPLRLTIEGLRSFRSPARRGGGRPPTVDFTGRDQVAIVGDTGAGKSSILEAITYALYGQTTFTARANQELMNDTSTHLRVVLRFEVSGETWEVARTLRRDGRGGVGQPRVQLRQLGPDDETLEQVEQVRPVNERVQALLGLDSDAFLRTVILPQGRFARLLVEDEPRDRSRILRQVWRTDELEAAGELAGAAHREAETLRVQLAQAASVYPDDPAAHLAGLQAAREAADRRAAAATDDEQAVRAAHAAVLAAQATQRAAADVAERLHTIDIERAAGLLAPIAETERRIAAEEAAHERRQADLEAELSRIPTDDGPAREDVAVALERLGRLGDLTRTSEEAATDLRATAEDESRKQAQAQDRAESAEAAAKRAEEHSAKRAPLDEAAEAARRHRDAVERQHDRCAERTAERDDAREKLETLRTAETARGRDIESAQDAAHRAGREAAGADGHLAAARRAESAALAARGLHAGDACPLCRRALPDGWAAPDAAGLAHAEAVARAAHEAAREADDAVTRLRAERHALSRQADDAEAGLANAQAALDAARRALAREIRPPGAPPPAAPIAHRTTGLDAEAPAPRRNPLASSGDTETPPTERDPLLASLLDHDAPLPERDALLAPLATACTETAARLTGHDRRAEALRADAARQTTEADVARETVANARALAHRSRRHAVQALERLAAAVRAVPGPFRPSPDLPADPADLREVDTRTVTEQTQSAQARARVLEKREAERERLRREREKTREARSSLARRRRDEVDAPIEKLVGVLHACRDVVVQSAGRLALDIAVPAAVSSRDVGDLESHLAALRSTAAESSRAADEHARTADGDARAARADLTGIGRRFDPDRDLDDLDAIVAAVDAKAEEARFAQRRARGAADDFAAIVEDVQQLRTLLQTAEDRALALGDLEDALKPGAFLKWLTLRRSHRLLVHASRMLGEMTAGKYAFVEPGEADEQWRVLDRESNQARSPASLSGGEQFIASLSLALGMVEMMARSGGRLESLFLDEGFGSLDRNNLDAAVQALGAVAARGRMVGVISHVRAVAEQIDHVLAVTRGAAGSRAEWLTDRQRRRLSESDTGLEAASALAGLLE